MILLEVNNVTKKFGDKVVLKNISFKLEEGESLGILGRSGAGKSVLLHMLRGMDGYEPTEGNIIYHVSYCEGDLKIGPVLWSHQDECDAVIKYNLTTAWQFSVDNCCWVFVTKPEACEARLITSLSLTMSMIVLRVITISSLSI